MIFYKISFIRYLFKIKKVFDQIYLVWIEIKKYVQNQARGPWRKFIKSFCLAFYLFIFTFGPMGRVSRAMWPNGAGSSAWKGASFKKRHVALSHRQWLTHKRTDHERNSVQPCIRPSPNSFITGWFYSIFHEWVSYNWNPVDQGGHAHWTWTQIFNSIRRYSPKKWKNKK